MRMDIEQITPTTKNVVGVIIVYGIFVYIW